MKILGWTLLAIAALAYLGGVVAAVIAAAVVAFPVGLAPLAGVGGLGILFAQVLWDRLRNEEDDYYDRNVDQ